MSKSINESSVIIDENVTNNTTDSDIKTLSNKVDKLTIILENKTDKLIERLDKILVANGIYWYTLMLK